MTPEGKVKKQVKEFLDSLGEDCWYYCPVPMGYGRKGIPDIIGGYKGKFFAIECKAQGKEPTVWQRKEEQAIHQAGCFCLQVRGDAKWLPAWFKEFM